LRVNGTVHAQQDVFVDGTVPSAIAVLPEAQWKQLLSVPNDLDDDHLWHGVGVLYEPAGNPRKEVIVLAQIVVISTSLRE